MTAREREQKRGEQSAPAVPMHRLLASCAAAEAVSKPPAPEESDRQDIPRARETAPAPEEEPGQDAA